LVFLRGGVVAVSIERSENQLPILLGGCCVGAVYILIDPAYLKGREEHMLTDAAAAPVIVSSAEHFDIAFTGKLISLDAITEFKVAESIL